MNQIQTQNPYQQNQMNPNTYQSQSQNNIFPSQNNDQPYNHRLNPYKENTESNYLYNRVGSYHKFPEPAVVFNTDPKSSLFIQEKERFEKDFAKAEYDRRNQETERKKNRFENLKNILFDRERKRWEKMDYEYLKNENKNILNKERNIVGRKNNAGMAFNPITLEYDRSVQGEMLRKIDTEHRERALLRAKHLDLNFNSQYNLLTGDDRRVFDFFNRKQESTHSHH